MKISMLAATLLAACGACGEVAHFVYPVPGHPDWGQSIQHRTYDLNQKEAHQIAWGIAARFKGIDPTVRR